MPYFHIFGKFRETLMALEYVIFAGVGVMDCVLAPDVETIRDSDQLRPGQECDGECVYINPDQHLQAAPTQGQCQEISDQP